MYSRQPCSLSKTLSQFHHPSRRRNGLSFNTALRMVSCHLLLLPNHLNPSKHRLQARYHHSRRLPPNPHQNHCLLGRRQLQQEPRRHQGRLHIHRHTRKLLFWDQGRSQLCRGRQWPRLGEWNHSSHRIRWSLNHPWVLLGQRKTPRYRPDHLRSPSIPEQRAGEDFQLPQWVR